MRSATRFGTHARREGTVSGGAAAADTKGGLARRGSGVVAGGNYPALHDAALLAAARRNIGKKSVAASRCRENKEKIQSCV